MHPPAHPNVLLTATPFSLNQTAVRFPDGSRVQRRFEQSCPLTALRDLCLAQNLEAAGGRSFALVPAYPGTLKDQGGEHLALQSALTVPAQSLPPLLLAGAAPLDLNAETTLEAAGVANSMVVMKWDD